MTQRDKRAPTHVLYVELRRDNERLRQCLLDADAENGRLRDVLLTAHDDLLQAANRLYGMAVEPQDDEGGPKRTHVAVDALIEQARAGDEWISGRDLRIRIGEVVLALAEEQPGESSP